MNYRVWLLVLVLGAAISSGYKAISNTIEEYRHKVISDQVCRVSEAKLQVGSAKEVVDVAEAALKATGHPDAELSLRIGKVFFVESELNQKEAKSFSCAIQGRDNVAMDIYFPRLSFFDAELGLAFMISLAILLSLKILFSILLKGLQNKFIDETDKRLAAILGFSNAEKSKSPAWIEWLYKTDPRSVVEFKNKLGRLEGRVSKQSKKIKTQAQEKAWHDFQLTQARKFKDLAHQVRHDLRQTLGVIKSSVETLPNQTEKSILSGAVSSLEFMIEDLKEREFENADPESKPLEILEVALHEVISEQRVYLGANSKISLALDLSDHELHVVGIQSSALKRIFTNLVRNSIEAISTNTGSVKISTVKMKSNRVLIAVEDTGCGFSTAAMVNLFKKGFSTKQTGSGLGLSSCLEKVREWGGTLCVDPSSHKTRIEIELPLADVNCSFAHPSMLADISNALVIDDHPLENELNAVMATAPLIVRSLADFERRHRQNKIAQDQTLIFDLHLEGGRKALEVIGSLQSGTDYLFMTSDYLNSALLEAAEKGQFLVIPKDLIGHTLERSGHLAKPTVAAMLDKTCPELPAQI